jgi:hypothetical protein
MCTLGLVAPRQAADRYTESTMTTEYASQLPISLCIQSVRRLASPPAHDGRIEAGVAVHRPGATTTVAAWQRDFVDVLEMDTMPSSAAIAKEPCRLATNANS